MGTTRENKFLRKFLRIYGADYNVYLVCTNKHDGFGAQAIRVMSTIAFCLASGVTYVHRPFEQVWGGSSDDLLYSARCENFLSLGRTELRLTDLGCVPQSCEEACAAPQPFSGRNICLGIVSTVPILRIDPPAVLRAIPLLRERFDFDRKMREAGEETQGDIRIAAHVRRGDVSLERHAGRYTANSTYLDALQKIGTELRRSGMTPRFEIFSQGDASHFEDLAPLEPTLRLNGDLFEDFTRMVSADVLFVAKSALSYVAALYSTGVKFYQPFWVEPMPGWLPYGEGQDINLTGFRAQMSDRKLERDIRRAWARQGRDAAF